MTSPEVPPVYVVSGGKGTSGERLVHSLLAQFPGVHVPVCVMADVHHVTQVAHAVLQARLNGGAIVHTLVDPHLRTHLLELAAAEHVAAFDLVGPLLSHLSAVLRTPPIGQPGRYRQLHQDYFTRVEAMEYTVAHDDGKHPDGWPQADILLLGVSRVGKTPVSLYMSVLGWKVANCPLVPDIPLPPQWLQVPRQRVFGLHSEPSMVAKHRQKRELKLGVAASDYGRDRAVAAEVMQAQRFFRDHGIQVVNVTYKNVEALADEIGRAATDERASP